MKTFREYVAESEQKLAKEEIKRYGAVGSSPAMGFALSEEPEVEEAVMLNPKLAIHDPKEGLSRIAELAGVPVKEDPLLAKSIDDAAVAPTGALEEGKFAEVDMIFQDLISGQLDPYDIMNHPTNEAEKYVASILQKYYDEIAIERHLHPDDDFEKILAHAVDRLEQEYGSGN